MSFGLATKRLRLTNDSNGVGRARLWTPIVWGRRL